MAISAEGRVSKAESIDRFAIQLSKLEARRLSDSTG